MSTIYLDHAAATPLDPAVLAVMQPYFADRFYNPSSSYQNALSVAKDLNRARQRIAHWLGVSSSEIIFTAGGTEANNMAISGIMRHFASTNVVISAVEHEAILAPAQQYQHKIVPVAPDGRVDVDVLAKTIDEDTVLVSIMYANNELGTIEPIKRVAALLKEVRLERRQQKQKLPIYLHTDACQAAAYLDLHVARLGVDMMTINAGKIYGPKQAGALFVRRGVDIRPLILGGGQENGRRSGTENVAAAVGLAAALDMVQRRRKQEQQRLSLLQRRFVKSLKEHIPTAFVNGSLKHRLPNNVNVTFPGQDNETLLMGLDERGIMCATGSACSANSQEPSHVLRAIGLTEADSRSTLRFSFGYSTSATNVDTVIKALTELVS